jgi:GNAT superfamily N-acetyltransferase
VSTVSVRPLEDVDRQWAGDQIARQWGARMIVSKGKMYYPDKLPGFVAFQGDERVGLATYNIEAGDCELVSIQGLGDGHGAGSALLSAVKEAARSAGCRRLWLITTNDNLRALGFYQKRGMSLVAVYRNAMEAARKLKPQIPLIGLNGIPLRDEIELEMIL